MRLAKLKWAWGILKETLTEFYEDPALALGAATAFYASFSIGPLLVLVVGLAGLVFGQQVISNEVGRQLTSFIGPEATRLVQSMMRAQVQRGSLLTTIIGGVALVFGATGVFTQLQTSLNTIWGVTARPGHGLWLFIRDRILSLAMVLAIGFLLLLSTALSAFVNMFTHLVGTVIALPDWLVPLFDGLASFAVISALFTVMFKVLPDVKNRWSDVWIGGVGTAVLFTAGKYLLGVYLRHEISASAYGAGSAFIVILIYVYYASLILLLGAEFTQVYAHAQGSPVKPSKYAIADGSHKLGSPSPGEATA